MGKAVKKRRKKSSRRARLAEDFLFSSHCQIFRLPGMVLKYLNRIIPSNDKEQCLSFERALPFRHIGIMPFIRRMLPV
jgi:hypothetical protein